MLLFLQRLLFLIGVSAISRQEPGPSKRGIKYSTFQYEHFSTAIKTVTFEPTFNVVRCRFVSCISESDSGGAISITSQNSQFSATDSYFQHCFGVSGGGCAIVAMSSYFSRCCFVQCAAASKGSAILSILVSPIFENSGSFLTLYNCQKAADVVSFFNGQMSLQNSNFSYCYADGVAGPAFSTSPNAELVLCSLENNFGVVNTLFMHNHISKLSSSNFIKNNATQSIILVASLPNLTINNAVFIDNHGPFTSHVNISHIILDKCFSNIKYDLNANSSKNVIIHANGNDLTVVQSITPPIIRFDEYYCNPDNLDVINPVIFTRKDVYLLAAISFFLLGLAHIHTFNSIRRRTREAIDQERRSAQNNDTEALTNNFTFSGDDDNNQQQDNQNENQVIAQGNNTADVNNDDAPLLNQNV